MQKTNTIQHRILHKIIFYIIIIALWQAIYYIGANLLSWWKPYAMPSPVGVAETFLKLLSGNTLTIALLISLKRAFLGFGIAIIIGLAIGFLLATVPYLNQNLKPLVLGLQTLPSICWVPFAILWYGLNESAILFVIIIGSTFSIALSFENAIQNVNPLYIRAARTMGASGRSLYIKVIIPSAMPELISGLKQGWSFAWRALMSGEVMSASIGLGQVLLLGRDLADINQVMTVMIVIIIVGIIVDRLVFCKMEDLVRSNMGLNHK